MNRVTLVLGLLLAACNVDVGPNGRDVGAPCTGATQFPFPCDEQCFTSIAGTGVGMCSYYCTSDADCPNGTACIDNVTTLGPAMCAEVCDGPDRCADYGRGISCVSRKRIGTSGTISVCWYPSNAS